MKKIAFIGMGNMGRALVKGFAKSKKISKSNIFAFAPNQEKLAKNAKKYHYVPCKTLGDAIKNADTVVLACKPYQVEDVLKECANDLSGKALISIALGWNFNKLQQFLAKDVRIQFIMPNTPAMVGEGVFLFEKSNSLEAQERNEIWKIFEKFGIVEELDDNLMAIGGAVTGCGPAFVDLFIESYADAAVKYGISRSTAYKLVSYMILGSAKLQLKTEEHPAVLKDNVCSPLGSTIRGVTSLEESGFRSACIKSIDTIMQ